MSNTLFMTKLTGVIEDLGSLLEFLYEENYKDEPTYVFFIKDNTRKRIHLNETSLYYFENGIETCFQFEKGMNIFIETPKDKEFRLNINSIVMQFL